ncbi:glycoside hydrolase family 13 protein [Actinomycetospora sp. TBRC 11914]|uniref:glycoside hydrolase family 13 protein n=1 Tax=Actinomycetospora sp. TBRC 11914 TaxID=2729387 RepID=UPI0028977FEA|nr:glycoside hydrolase family 13 protein [Actinomycetospora sp. TBRC 11914]
MTTETPWWRDAVIYQVYIRSFADSDGDGIGDLAGLTDRLGYLADLGVDAVWINPWYASPQVDNGYDVADYRAVEPAYGTLADAEKLIARAHEHGLRVIPDLVPNHLSAEHAWFREALAAGPGSPERARFVFRPGRGPDGAEPPTNWRAHFGGPAWTRVAGPDGGPGEWYLHLFDPGQPDLDWRNAEVRAEFESVLRFWFDRGVDGFRVDVAHGLVKDPGLPDLADVDDLTGASLGPGAHPFADRDEVQEIYESWRRIAEEYPGARMFVAEAWVPSPERLARYVSPGRLHTAFNFDFLLAPWEPAALREAIDTTTGYLHGVGAPATWVLENHDVVRAPSRYGRRRDGAVDVALGERRARAAFVLMAALPGGVYVYQGQELGLPQVDDIPDEALRDPTWERSGHTERGRDGSRVPLPWTAGGSSFGFGPDGGDAPWLPQPDWFGRYAVDVESDDAGSTLALVRAALARRAALDALGEGPLTWESEPGDPVLSFRRGPGFACVVNLAAAPVPLPEHAEVLLTSAPLDDGLLPADCAVWLSVG